VIPEDSQRFSKGDRFVYHHPEGLGLGEHFRGGELTDEMKSLDLANGTPVTIFEVDEDTGWYLVEWTDSKGIDRITTVDPSFLIGYFDVSTEDEEG
jgi:hypothetical protein